MKRFFKNFFEGFFEVIFSFPVFLFVFILGFVCFMLSVSESDAKARLALQKATAACYVLGAVLIQTDAGPRCVASENLIEPK